ncbi:MAG: DNA replication and repair protein RecF [Chloroflexota bacterium]|nr:DNA replication and repair protein RecF [Chloroflexota bacterium]
MWLSQLTLVNFRNFRRLHLQLDPGVLVFRGRNGQGKSNLLEGVYVLATSRSPRTSVERELLSWQTPEDADLAAVVPPYARLEGSVRRLEHEVHLQLLFETVAGEASPGIARSIKVNGLPTRAAGLVGQLPVVYFSPADVALAGGPPAGRRQYLNLANSQVSADHLRALQRYNRVLLQRNQVLRQVRERRQPPSALEPWTEGLIEWGVQVLRQRVCMLRDVGARAAPLLADLAGVDQRLRIVYRSTAGEISQAMSTADLASSFRQQQARLAAREVEQAVSLVGPHRDDFSFLLDDIDLTTFGSRGQQRLAVLALKLAEADWMRDQIGDMPVILLDDVLSELDPERREFVLRRVVQPARGAPRQVWITSTDLHGSLAELEGLNAASAGRTTSVARDLLLDAQRFEIDAGQVRRA